MIDLKTLTQHEATAKKQEQDYAREIVRLAMRYLALRECGVTLEPLPDAEWLFNDHLDTATDKLIWECEMNKQQLTAAIAAAEHTASRRTEMSEPCKFSVGDTLYFPNVPEFAENCRGRTGQLAFIDHDTESRLIYGIDFGEGYAGCRLAQNTAGFMLPSPTGRWFNAADMSYAKPALLYDVAPTGACTLRNEPAQPAQSGLKHDGGKPLAAIPYQDFPHALSAVVDVATFGAAKYARSSWKTVPNAAQRYADAMHRHMLAQARGEFRDAESGLPHSAHIAWNALALAELELATEPACTAQTTQHTEKNS